MLMERWLQLKMGLFHAHRNHERNKNKKKEKRNKLSDGFHTFRGLQTDISG